MGKQNTDLTGQRFGRLVVVGRTDPPYETTQKQRWWLCQCDCGNTITSTTGRLCYGNTRSCGCLKHDVDRVVNITHGGSETKLYEIWLNMKQRCRNKNRPDAKHYIDRGITVCEEWMDFGNFRDWALNATPPYTDDPKVSLDRIDVDGNYEPANCRWVPWERQARNRHDTIKLTYHGVTKPLADWADELHLSHAAVKDRYYRGWSAEQILETPVVPGGLKTKHFATIGGITKSLVEWAREYDLCYQTLYQKVVKMGMDIADAISNITHVEVPAQR